MQRLGRAGLAREVAREATPAGLVDGVAKQPLEREVIATADVERYAGHERLRRDVTEGVAVSLRADDARTFEMTALGVMADPLEEAVVLGLHDGLVDQRAQRLGPIDPRENFATNG